MFSRSLLKIFTSAALLLVPQVSYALPLVYYGVFSVSTPGGPALSCGMEMEFVSLGVVEVRSTSPSFPCNTVDFGVGTFNFSYIANILTVYNFEIEGALPAYFCSGNLAGTVVAGNIKFDTTVSSCDFEAELSP